MVLGPQESAREELDSEYNTCIETDPDGAIDAPYDDHTTYLVHPYLGIPDPFPNEKYKHLPAGASHQLSHRQ